ncbi:TPA: AlpA family phage regulatory protein [Escherichia albertii]|nr:AlpA family phage regulatory protein [Escherichia albertii]EFB4472162.1 AlpA family phage regulatory protein [Escherichia coli]EFB4475684.1 AlpA family phage regulatory protein [Escherichia coli]HEB1530385.1 AlpA family phage regulatory protein [Escherichia albertii]HEB1544468.1 AlpA family phage regulatory protein [Escherichia albertii]
MTSTAKPATRTTADIDLHSDKMVDMAFIVKFTGLTDKWFYKLISEGLFPTPIKMGRSSRWLESEVRQWLVNRIEASRN